MIIYFETSHSYTYGRIKECVCLHLNSINKRLMEDLRLLLIRPPSLPNRFAEATYNTLESSFHVKYKERKSVPQYLTGRGHDTYIQ